MKNLFPKEKKNEFFLLSIKTFSIYQTQQNTKPKPERFHLVDIGGRRKNAILSNEYLDETIRNVNDSEIEAFVYRRK